MRVAVIGGGWAGLAAAVELARRDVPVTVFEAARQLGGRARRVDHRGVSLDNGQHILLGAYRETLRLVELVSHGRSDRLLLRLPLRLAIAGRFELRTPALPAPLHLLLGLLAARGLPVPDRIRALAFMSGIRRKRFRLERDAPLAALLARHRQSEAAVRLLWEPLCLAALNTPLRTASAQVFLNVLRDSFSRSRSDSDLLLPRADLSAVFPDLAAGFIKSHGGAIRLSESVLAVSRKADGFTLSTASGNAVFSHVVCAAPPRRTAELLAGLPQAEEIADRMQALEYQPICTVYLQYPTTVRLPHPMVGLTEGFAQWAFDRGQTHDTPGLIAAIISAEGPHRRLSSDELEQRIELELAQAFDLPPAAWRKTITEKRATFACTVDLQRPEQQTPVKNFYLAGDHTAGDYPATLEGAVQSGVKCALSILESRLQ